MQKILSTYRIRRLIRDNANIQILFKQDDLNIVYNDHVGNDMSFDDF